MSMLKGTGWEITKKDCKVSQLPNVEPCQLEDEGTFMYLLFKVYCANARDFPLYIVRSSSTMDYHSRLYQTIKSALLPLISECLGGGMIDRNNEAKTIHVYDTSTGFDQAPHLHAASIIKEDFSNYKVTIEKCSGVFYEVVHPNNFYFVPYLP